MGAKERKLRYFQKKEAAAAIIECACGCGEQIKNIDAYGRPKKFISGHNNRKYDDPKQYKREWNHRNRPYRQRLKSEAHRRKKVKLIEHLGNKCNHCGILYDGTNAAIFHFHHVDPTSKLFAIGNRLTTKGWATILDEISKCILLCANCHELAHSQQF